MKNKIGQNVLAKTTPAILIPKDQKVAQKITKEIKGKTIVSMHFVRNKGDYSFYDIHFTDGTVLRIFGKLIMFGTERR